jgi:hypothetical protein
MIFPRRPSSRHRAAPNPRAERDERGRVAVPEAEEALDHAAAVVLGRAVVAAAVPLLLQALRHLVDVVDLVDRHALVGQCSTWLFMLA